jgi:isopenicillin N synthase-like dioxygenase
VVLGGLLCFLFSQIINHGVPPALLNDILHTHKEFFEMPLEEQMKYYSKDTNAPFKFSVVPLLPPHLIQPWKDGLTVIYSKGMDTTNWPTKPTTFM